MTNLQWKHGSTVYALAPDMKVYVNDAAVGNWRATARDSEEKRNGLHVDAPATPGAFVPVKYAFNGDNQLTVLIAAPDGGVSNVPVPLNGSIDIDDNDDVIYRLLTTANQPSQTALLTVYGHLSLSPGATQLNIALAEGGQTQIKALPLLQRVSVNVNSSTTLPGDDALTFRAATRNKPDNGTPFTTQAHITFTGKWDIQDSKLVFLSQIQSDPDGFKAALAFRGKIGPVAAGFQFTNQDGDPKLAFQVYGEHRWDSGEAAWQLALGYSRQQFFAQVNGQVAMTPGAGQTLTIQSDLRITGRADETGQRQNITPLAVQMNLKATYRLDQPGRTVVFEANLSSSPTGFNYNLMLSGTFQVRGGQLSFKADFSNAATTVKLAFAIQTGGASIAIDLLVSDRGGQPSVSFDISVTYVDGVLVKQNPISNA